MKAHTHTKHTQEQMAGRRCQLTDAPLSVVNSISTAKGRKTFKDGSVPLLTRAENETSCDGNPPTDGLFMENDTESLSGRREDNGTGTVRPICCWVSSIWSNKFTHTHTRARVQSTFIYM